VIKRPMARWVVSLTAELGIAKGEFRVSGDLDRM